MCIKNRFTTLARSVRRRCAASINSDRVVNRERESAGGGVRAGGQQTTRRRKSCLITSYAGQIGGMLNEGQILSTRNRRTSVKRERYTSFWPTNVPRKRVYFGEVRPRCGAARAPLAGELGRRARFPRLCVSRKNKFTTTPKAVEKGGGARGPGGRAAFGNIDWRSPGLELSVQYLFLSQRGRSERPRAGRAAGGGRPLARRGRAAALGARAADGGRVHNLRAMVITRADIGFSVRRPRPPPPPDDSRYKGTGAPFASALWRATARTARGPHATRRRRRLKMSQSPFSDRIGVCPQSIWMNRTPLKICETTEIVENFRS
ncbi:hypothetical protein EVAR_7878_1 [Eumeta japonica]|uniref:Uncharacterized protein n=1 Tax=Eumeta variegata TaxID=151549 RepID=A0A4C1TV35_EUMVA|nr:hypothetical protein EVAR_7878_1 [Eumeta japonica]